MSPLTSTTLTRHKTPMNDWEPMWGLSTALPGATANRFGKEIPHPKMDALVERLAEQLPRGEKALVFVRRVASVKELRAKLEERYDEWLIERLRSELPDAIVLDRVFQEYQAQRRARRQGRLEPVALTPVDPDEDGAAFAVQASSEAPDRGGVDTFFAYFFRGEGPEGVLSGAALQRRFTQASSAYSTFFDDNYVAWLLELRPDGSGSVLEALCERLGRAADETRGRLLIAPLSTFPFGRTARSVGSTASWPCNSLHWACWPSTLALSVSELASSCSCWRGP